MSIHYVTLQDVEFEVHISEGESEIDSVKLVIGGAELVRLFGEAGLLVMLDEQMRRDAKDAAEQMAESFEERRYYA